MAGPHEVTGQLSEQLISFPAKGSAELPAAHAAYAGQQVSTGGQAKAYADMIDLVTGLGVAFLGIGAATLAVTGLTEVSRRRIRVPDTLAVPA